MYTVIELNILNQVGEYECTFETRTFFCSQLKDASIYITFSSSRNFQRHLLLLEARRNGKIGYSMENKSGWNGNARDNWTFFFFFFLRVKRKLALLLIKLVGKHGFKCGLKRLRDTPAKFRMIPPVDPGSAHTTGSSFPLAEQNVWSEGHVSLKRLSLALLSSVSWPHLSDVSLLPTGAKNERWWAVFPNNFHLWGIECTSSALFRTSQVER